MTDNDRFVWTNLELQIATKVICEPGDIATALKKYSVTTLAQSCGFLSKPKHGQVDKKSLQQS